MERIHLDVCVERTELGTWWIGAGPRSLTHEAPMLVTGDGNTAYRAACALLRKHFIEVFKPEESS